MRPARGVGPGAARAEKPASAVRDRRARRWGAGSGSVWDSGPSWASCVRSSGGAAALEDSPGALRPPPPSRGASVLGRPRAGLKAGPLRSRRGGARVPVGPRAVSSEQGLGTSADGPRPDPQPAVGPASCGDRTGPAAAAPPPGVEPGPSAPTRAPHPELLRLRPGLEGAARPRETSVAGGVLGGPAAPGKSGRALRTPTPGVSRRPGAGGLDAAATWWPHTRVGTPRAGVPSLLSGRKTLEAASGAFAYEALKRT